MGQKKNKKKVVGGKKLHQYDINNDDWEALLEVEHSNVNKEEINEERDEGELPLYKDAKLNAQDAAAAFLESQGLYSGGDKKEKKKKKKKKKCPGGGDGTKEENKISARGKLVAERLRLQREEEERIRVAEEAELQRIAAIEAAEETKKKRIEEEKERKRKKRQEKIIRQKKEGKYMTKAQKQKAAIAQQRLETMKAAGMVIGPGGNVNESRRKAVNRNRKKHVTESDKHDNEKKNESVFLKEESKTEVIKGNDEVDLEQNFLAKSKEDNLKEKIRKNHLKNSSNLEVMSTKIEDLDTSSGDEWDVNSEDGIFGDLDERLKQVKAFSESDDEDLIKFEKKIEQDRLRQLGIERRKREEEENEKRKELFSEQKELERQKQIIVQRREEAKKKREKKEKEHLEARSRDNLRCPIVVIMGHVDTGKTKFLDKIRDTNVQGGEAGGITQQIGATYFEKETLLSQTFNLNQKENFDMIIPGMLVIDTPGHESFANLRSRGSSLCDVAILIVDLMHGLEQQTIESLKMLRNRSTPFIVVLNKVDRCYGWKTCTDSPIRDALKEQLEGTIAEFRSRSTETKIQLQEMGINSNLYWEMGVEDWSNSDFVPLLPTSAVTGEGIEDVLLLLCQMSQRKLWRQLMWHANLECTVLEVKQIDGLGMTVDVLLVNGFLKEGDTAVFCTLDGPILTEIRGLLTPPPNREMRIKTDYIRHKVVKGSIGVKLIGNGLDKVMAGTRVLTINNENEQDHVKEEIMSDVVKLERHLSIDKKGVMVHASTLGALEALLQFLREDSKPPIPVSAVAIGAIQKRDVTKISIMNEQGFPEYSSILAFDVDINAEAKEYAREVGVRIFRADIIYHLFDQFTTFMNEFQEKKREEATVVAVFPCVIKILPEHIFNQKDPIIVGVEVIEGILKVGTPLSIPNLGNLHVGKVISLETNGKEQNSARKGISLACKIINEENPTITYGRQFDSTHNLYSSLSRSSIDALKTNFKDKLDVDDWKLVVKLKKVFNII